MIKPLVILSAVATLNTSRGQEETKTAPAAIKDEATALSPAKEQIRENRAAAADVKKERVEKPERPERPDKGERKIDRAEVKESVEEIKSNFRAKAQEYVKKQKEVLAELKQGSLEEKSKAREKLKDLKENWKNEQPDVREMVSDLKEKIDKEKEKNNGKVKGKARD